MPKYIQQSDWDYWYDKVYGYFYRRVNSRYDTEELTADTLNSFFLSETDHQNNYGYLWGIAKNKFYTYLKQKNQEKLKQQTLQNSLEEVVLNTNIRSDHYNHKMQVLQECINRCLKNQDQEIVKLCVQEDFSSQEVSKILSISSGNVRVRLARAIKKIRDNCSKIWLLET